MSSSIRKSFRLATALVAVLALGATAASGSALPKSRQGKSSERELKKDAEGSFEALEGAMQYAEARTAPADHLAFADLRLEPSTRSAWRGDRTLELTATEFDLLRHFLRHPRQVLSREQLIDAVWKGEVDSDRPHGPVRGA